MIVDQEEIETLLAQAGGLVNDAATDEAESAPAQASPPSSIPAPAKPPHDASPEVARLMKIRVPVIVLLAWRPMTISAARKLSLGMIIEFHKSIDEPLELLVNNHPVGRGEAVKVNERFGLHITEIRDQATRIRSMGS
jgi:flagellar motor switch protein FliN